jgi:four helix bundle protein
VQDFEKLAVWRRAHALALRVDIVVRNMPRRGCSSLKAQLTRAVDSIATNIAEGCGAATQREFARYLDIAIKSCSESQHHLITVRDRRLVPAETCPPLIDEVVEIRRMTYGLRKQVRGNDDSN